jgi:hypothetical protein
MVKDKIMCQLIQRFCGDSWFYKTGKIFKSLGSQNTGAADFTDLL